MSHTVMITEKAVLLEWFIFFLSIHIKKYNNTIYKQCSDKIEISKSNKIYIYSLD